MTELLQQWLALEHEAVWLYGAIGGRFDDVRKKAAKRWEAHRELRDRLSAMLARAGETPASPALGYGKPLASIAAARKAAAGVELRIATTCVRVMAEGHREFAIETVRDVSEAAVTWGATPQAFPGLD